MNLDLEGIAEDLEENRPEGSMFVRSMAWIF
jgi:hypothetical protein